MKRDYDTGVSDTPVLFVGQEVEHTRHFDEKTLFVVGLDFPLVNIMSIAEQNNCTHIYLAANHSYPGNYTEQEWIDACYILRTFLYNVTLEVKHKDLTDKLIDISFILDFVLMVGCPIKHIHDNIVVKVDDVDFKASNKGVWTCTPTKSKDLHFTPWSAYTQDKVIQ